MINESAVIETCLVRNSRNSEKIASALEKIAWILGTIVGQISNVARKIFEQTRLESKSVQTLVEKSGKRSRTI